MILTISGLRISNRNWHVRCSNLFAYYEICNKRVCFPLIPALQKGLSIRGYWLTEIVTKPERLARAKGYVYDRIKTGQLRPKIAKTFRFEDVVEAYQYMESNEQIGKIVLTVGE